MKRVFAVVLAAAVFFAGCGQDDAVKDATGEVETTDSSVESKINRACGEGRITQVAMATRKNGYGSSTDYWLVLCDGGSELARVVRVEV